MLFRILYLIVTFIYPLNKTYQQLKTEKNDKADQIWAIYWSAYSVIFILKSYFAVFNMQTMEIVILLLSGWLYHPQYRGSLCLKEYLHKSFSQIQIVQNIISFIKDWNETFAILEDGDRND